MDIFGILELFDLNSFSPDGKPSAASGHYAILERKVDLLLRELHIDTTSLAESLALPADVRGLLAQGRKIEAIKLYRERTDAGLKEAKDAVEGHGGPTPWMLLERKLDLVLKKLGIEDNGGPVTLLSEVPGGNADSSGNDRVEALLRQGNLIGAIKVYREQTGAGLKESKDVVDAMAARLRKGHI